MKDSDRSRIISVTAQEMVLEEILTEKEISKGVKPERITYKKNKGQESIWLILAEHLSLQ